ncbi:hypothetical protein HK105_203204 [Polyrhizophydium stewartii]|uniref:Ankyrin repeat protein n=1 Tax=Polyrhizophydium stewartii TaxID=2732419 RepID=A0ABR4NC71_9FUNG
MTTPAAPAAPISTADALAALRLPESALPLVQAVAALAQTMHAQVGSRIAGLQADTAAKLDDLGAGFDRRLSELKDAHERRIADLETQLASVRAAAAKPAVPAAGPPAPGTSSQAAPDAVSEPTQAVPLPGLSAHAAAAAEAAAEPTKQAPHAMAAPAPHSSSPPSPAPAEAQANQLSDQDKPASADVEPEQSAVGAAPSAQSDGHSSSTLAAQATEAPAGNDAASGDSPSSQIPSWPVGGTFTFSSGDNQSILQLCDQLVLAIKAVRRPSAKQGTAHDTRGQSSSPASSAASDDWVAVAAQPEAPAAISTPASDKPAPATEQPASETARKPADPPSQPRAPAEPHATASAAAQPEACDAISAPASDKPATPAEQPASEPAPVTEGHSDGTATEAKYDTSHDSSLVSQVLGGQIETAAMTWEQRIEFWTQLLRTQPDRDLSKVPFVDQLPSMSSRVFRPIRSRTTFKRLEELKTIELKDTLQQVAIRNNWLDLVDFYDLQSVMRNAGVVKKIKQLDDYFSLAPSLDEVKSPNNVMTNIAKAGNFDLAKMYYNRYKPTTPAELKTRVLTGVAHQAASRGYVDMTLWVLSQPRKLASSDAQGSQLILLQEEDFAKQALYSALQNGHLKLAKIVSDKYFDGTIPDWMMCGGVNGLINAAGRNGHVDVVEWLYSKSIKCNLEGFFGAARNKRRSVVEWLAANDPNFAHFAPRS